MRSIRAKKYPDFLANVLGVGVVVAEQKAFEFLTGWFFSSGSFGGCQLSKHHLYRPLRRPMIRRLTSQFSASSDHMRYYRATYLPKQPSLAIKLCSNMPCHSGSGAARRGGSSPSTRTKILVELVQAIWDRMRAARHQRPRAPNTTIDATQPVRQ